MITPAHWRITSSQRRYAGCALQANTRWWAINCQPHCPVTKFYGRHLALHFSADNAVNWLDTPSIQRRRRVIACAELTETSAYIMHTASNYKSCVFAVVNRAFYNFIRQMALCLMFLAVLSANTAHSSKLHNSTTQQQSGKDTGSTISG